MAPRQLAAIAALAAACTPALAFDARDTGPSTMFYVSIPLESSLSRKEREPVFGLQLQGREHQAINFDTRMLKFLGDGGIEAKWIVAGLVAVGAAAALGGGGGGGKGGDAPAQTQQTQRSSQPASQPQTPQQPPQQPQPPRQPCPTRCS